MMQILGRPQEEVKGKQTVGSASVRDLVVGLLSNVAHSLPPCLAAGIAQRMGYWAEVARRAWFETAKTVKLDSRKLLMVLLLGQIVIGTILYVALGAENLPENMLARGATIAVPFLLFVPFFIWELISSPPKMHAEQVALLKCTTAAKESALQIASINPSARDSTILNLQEENAALHEQLSELRHSTDADYPFDAPQRAALIDFLSNVPEKERFVVDVRHSGFNGNSDYARRMARAFREADWNAQVFPDPMVQPTNEGVHLASCRTSIGELDPLSKTGELLRDALDSAGIKFYLDGYEWPDNLEKPSWQFFVFPPCV